MKPIQSILYIRKFRNVPLAVSTKGKWSLPLILKFRVPIFFNGANGTNFLGFELQSHTASGIYIVFVN